MVEAMQWCQTHQGTFNSCDPGHHIIQIGLLGENKAGIMGIMGVRKALVYFRLRLEGMVINVMQQHFIPGQLCYLM